MAKSDDSTTLYEKLTTTKGKALSSGLVTAGSLLGMRTAVGSQLGRKSVAKLIGLLDKLPKRKAKQLSLNLGLPDARANKIRADRVVDAVIGKKRKVKTRGGKDLTLPASKEKSRIGVLSGKNIAGAGLLGGATGAIFANYERNTFADNLRTKLETGKKLTRSEKEAVRQIADMRKLPRKALRDTSARERGGSLLWSPGKMALISGGVGLISGGPALARVGNAVAGGGSTAAETKYRSFIMSKALRDRFKKDRKLLPGERKLIRSVRRLGAQNA